MKIAFVNILYSIKDEGGGLVTHIADVSRELARCGHDVSVLTSGMGNPYAENGVTIVPLGQVKRYSQPSQLLDLFNVARRLRYMWRVARYARSARFDVVEAAEGGFEQLFLILLRVCPVVTKLHGNFRFIYGDRSFLGSIVEKFEAFVVKRSDAIYTSSVAYARTLSKAFDVSFERIKIIPYGICVPDLKQPKSDHLEEPFRVVANRKVVFLAVGNSPARKGADLFVEIARRLKHLDLLFVISATYEQHLPLYERPANLLVLPNLERSDFYKWIERADLMVFPSEFESFGIAVREAMLLEKTIVVSPAIPLEEVEMEYPKHFVLPKNDADNLERAILQITNGKQNGQELTGAYLEALKNKYDIQRIAQATLKLYDDAMNTFQKRAEN